MNLQASVIVILHLVKAVIKKKSDKRKEFFKFLKVILHFTFFFHLVQHSSVDLVVLLYRTSHLLESLPSFLKQTY